jgi:hypothetical protein
MYRPTIKVVPPIGREKSASDENSRNSCNTAGSITMKMANTKLIKFSFRRFGSYFQKNCWRVDFKRTSKLFDIRKLDLMSHQWPKEKAL